MSWLGKAVAADSRARTALDALGRSGTLPGGLNKLLHGALLGLPRGAEVRMMGRIVREMT